MGNGGAGETCAGQVHDALLMKRLKQDRSVWPRQTLAVQELTAEKLQRLFYELAGVCALVGEQLRPR